MSTTSIEWTDYSHNPIRARLKGVTGTKGGYGSGVGHYCEKVSPGCLNCYSSATQGRFGMPAFPGQRGNDDVEVFLDEARLAEPLSWRKPRKVFLCDMTDLFGQWVPDEWLDRIFAVMALTPHITWQVLTKRPERMAEYLASNKGGARGRFGQIEQACLDWHDKATATQWPLPNIWLGTSCENQATADERIPHLLRCPAAVRFVSAEPLIGPIDFSNYLMGGPHRNIPFGNIHQIIAGGESGPKARPCNVDWIRSIVGQCKAADVACFVKQLGSEPCGAMHVDSEKNWGGPVPNCDWNLRVKDRKGGDPAEWPADLRVREYPR